VLQARTNARYVGTKKKTASRSSRVESVEFYTGIPSLLRFTFLLNTLLPYTENMEYMETWISTSHYRKDVQKKKSGRQRVLQVKEDVPLVLLRLKLRLMERHLADMFAVMVSTVSPVNITWVRFLALTLKGSLLR